MTWKNDQVTSEETEKILELARECINREGDFVEFGCYRGDTALLVADILKGSPKRLWLYDSFEGLPEKSKLDESTLGESFKKGELCVAKREVKKRFLRAGLKVPIIKKAWFQDLTEMDLPSKIAFAFLDGDFYESIRDSLKLIEDKMEKSGVIIIHDYLNLALPGVKRAVDDWLASDNKAVAKKEMYKTLLIIKF